MKIHYLPLENIESRYTVMMNDVLYPLVDEYYYPEGFKQEKIKKGEFLDIERTILFKAKQIEMVSEAFSQGKIQNGDAFLIGDMFFPGIEAIRYMAELQDIKIYMAGFNYAGRADETDFVRKLGEWADYSELGYHKAMDVIFTGSENHKNNIQKYFQLNEDKVIVTGLIWDVDWVENMLSNKYEGKEDVIIWPHRPCKEKGFDELLQFARSTSKKIIITSSGDARMNMGLPENIKYVANLTKKEYFQILKKSRWYLSTAYQETFGYTLQEAIYYGCEILVPDRACYCEMVPEQNVYCSLEEIDRRFDTNNLIVPMSYTLRWSKNQNKVVDYVRGLS